PARGGGTAAVVAAVDRAAGRALGFRQDPGADDALAGDPGRSRRDRRSASGLRMAGDVEPAAAGTGAHARHLALLPSQADGPARRDQAGRAALPADRMTPSGAYAAGVARGDWQDDPAQHPALAELDRIHAALSDAPAHDGFLSKLFARKAPASTPGLYLWGGVGRGKTFLIDLFYDQLPIERK